MKNGLYEKLLDEITKKKLDTDKSKTRQVDQSETSKVVSIGYQKLIRKKLNHMKYEDKLEFIKRINKTLGLDDFSMNDNCFEELLCVHEDENIFIRLNKNRPKTSIANSTLFTGNTGPTLESELKREIRTADRMDFLISFIKFSGLRLIYDDLVEFTKHNKLRVITTSYMGASDLKAITQLAKLPNTEVKISYDTKRTRLHAKAYYFERNTGFSTAYIGSSNLSNPALSKGLEWNVKVSEYTSPDVMNNFYITFESYWHDEEFRLFDPNNIEDVEELKTSLTTKSIDYTSNIYFDINPYSYQKEILEDLKVEREAFNSYRNLIVAATGTGKTMVAAFDYKKFKKENPKSRLLFLAHRKEILEQSLMTFRAVLKDQNFGEIWAGGNIPTQYEYIFATIQTLNSRDKYSRIEDTNYDYIIIDESHHSSASSYLNIIEYFKPQILLGLTATPERMDGCNILDYFNNRIASEIRLPDAINRKLLSPFHYFGVTDPEDISNLKWRRGGYEISELENVYTKSKQRVRTIMNAMNKYLNNIDDIKALGFCVSIAHADFMMKSFNEAKIPSISLHSRSSKEERYTAKKKLQKGEIKCIFTVDLFNEGVDIPEIDTVLFLRPTESLTVFLQQLGRGLRLYEDKEALTVLDFVGQAHKNYDFSIKYRALMGKSHRGLKEEIIDEFPNMPAGCHIKLEKIAKEYILNNIQSSTFNKNKLSYMIRTYKENFSTPLTLENFLNNYSIERDLFYSRYSFRNLLYVNEIINEYQVENEKELKQALRRFARIDSKKLLLFSKHILENDINALELNEYNTKLLGMFHYTIWGKVPENSYLDSLKTLKEKNSDIVKELLEIIDYNLKYQKILEIEYSDREIPLELYESYTIDQVLSVFDKNTEIHKYPMRQGVLYIKEKNTDLFFVTINKSEGDYLPSTMYNDYAIDNKLFHWESQSVTSVESPTGRRYIYDRSKAHKVLFFVREMKKLYGQSSPYIFLGNAKYISHKGSRPIQIKWRLENEIPEKIINESKLKLVK